MRSRSTARTIVGNAEFEREPIRARTSKGRKPKFTQHQKAEAIKRREKGESPAAIARSYNVSRWTIQRLQ